MTTDKVYENHERECGYREDEPKGGHDPYSNSKACSELVTAAYRDSFFAPGRRTAVASARAGNVIGGGDWGEDRLIPDLMRGVARAARATPIRNPDAVRPWQHVLNPLSGYLMLAERMWESHDYAEAWNFGPDERDALRSAVIADGCRSCGATRSPGSRTRASIRTRRTTCGSTPPRPRTRLGWAPRWDLDAALVSIAEWYRGYRDGADPRELVRAADRGVRGRARAQPATPATARSRHHSTVSASVRSSGISGSQPVAAVSFCVRAADLGDLVLAQQRRVGRLLELDARVARKAREDLADLGRAPAAHVVDAGRRSLEREPVGAHDVAHVGEVAAHVEVAGHDLDRLAGAARRFGLGDLARELRDHVRVGLPGPGVVEGPHPHDVHSVGVGVEAGREVARGLADRVGVLGPQVVLLGQRAGCRGCRTPRPSRRPARGPPGSRGARASSTLRVEVEVGRGSWPPGSSTTWRPRPPRRGGTRRRERPRGSPRESRRGSSGRRSRTRSGRPSRGRRAGAGRAPRHARPGLRTAWRGDARQSRSRR